MTPRLDSVPSIVEGAQGSRLGGDFVVLDARAEILRGLNDTGRRVWELCDGQRDLRAIAEVIAQEFGADASTARNDVLAFVGALASKGLLQLSQPRSGAAAHEEVR